MTSAEAMKQLKELEIKRRQILQEEQDTSVFTVATSEIVENVRPEYDFKSTLISLEACENNIRELKHRLNVFNTTYMVPELGMTIDQVLVSMPMLSGEVNKLRNMAARLEKKRCSSYSARVGLIEYEYINYDRDQVKQEYDKKSKRLAEMQIALDKANTTVDIL